ncbi:hypothetical protein [Streptomyces microflavus]|uniref:hypothetical protein n=1 Tax=Streptomyces microflavus TaxID=1919 RepID=UPI0034083725
MTRTLSLSGDTLADAARPADQDLAPVVQSWLEQDSAEGLTLQLPKGSKDSVVYHSGLAKDAAQRPQLVIDYVPAAAPGRPQDVRATSGHGGLLATWNPPGGVQAFMLFDRVPGRPGRGCVFVCAGEPVRPGTQLCRRAASRCMGLAAGDAVMSSRSNASWSGLPGSAV